MSIFNSSYETTIGSSMKNVKQIEHAIKEACIKDLLYNSHLNLITSLDFKPLVVTGSNASESNIPFFIHPLVIQNFNGHNFVCIDVRPFIKKESTYWNIQVRSYPDFNFAKNRLIMNLAWLNNEVGQLRVNLSFASQVFAGWISESISKRFALDPRDHMTLTVIAHYYYLSLFYPEDHIEEETLQKFAVHTIKATKFPSEFVFQVFDQIDSMKNIHDFCENVKRILNNIRLENLNEGLLITVLSNSWYGLNASENLAVALEHPPTWLAIVYAALQEKTFKHSLVARVAERYGKNNQASEFIKNFDQIVANYSEKEDQGVTPKFSTFE